MTQYFKVVYPHRQTGKYLSALHNQLPQALVLRYEIGVWTRPLCGRSMVFGNQDAAFDFAELYAYTEVFLVEVQDPVRVWFCPNPLDLLTSTHAAIFWDDEVSWRSRPSQWVAPTFRNIVYGSGFLETSRAPAHTYGARGVKLIERVRKSYHEIIEEDAEWPKLRE